MRSNTTQTMPIGENGTSLAGRLIPQALTDAAARFVDSLKLSSVSEKVRRGKRVVFKRRNAYSEQLADLANLYFRMSSIPIRFWSKVEDWRRWESECFQMLNGDRFRVLATGAKTVCVDKLPGKTLWDHLNRGTLTRQMLEAVGRELRRAHQLWSDEFGGGWSHGDATMSNVIYDSRRWLPFSLSFLNAYGDPVVIAELTDHLALPSGMAWIWWGVRTSFADPAKVKQRLAKLRDVTANLGYYRAFAAKRARQRRRPSTSCQVMSAGIPRPISRARATRARAKAPSPEMPSKWPTTR